MTNNESLESVVSKLNEGLAHYKKAVIGNHYCSDEYFKGTCSGFKSCIEVVKGMMSAQPAQQPELTVWCGPMPESNGKSNFTAILRRKDGSTLSGLSNGITIDHSEYPDRVRYAADRARYLIGELSERPSILDYDADKHSGYVAPAEQPVSGAVDERKLELPPPLPTGYTAKHVDGHGWIITPPSGSNWIAFDDTPVGDFLRALAGETALSTQPQERVAENKPVAWRWKFGPEESANDRDWRFSSVPLYLYRSRIIEPLYTTPPQLAGLTDERIWEIWGDYIHVLGVDAIGFARAILAAAQQQHKG